MTTIIRLTTADQLPASRREYRLEREGDEELAIEKFARRYHRVPERAYVWRGMMYVEEER